jgi:hypothetical protein
LLSATGAPVLSDFVVAVALAAACDGPAKHTNIPVASINAERPLALVVIWQSPHLPVPGSEMRPCRVSAAGQKKGIFGLHRAKAGQKALSGRAPGRPRRGKSTGIHAARVSETERCYEPAGG